MQVPVYKKQPYKKYFDNKTVSFSKEQWIEALDLSLKYPHVELKVQDPDTNYYVTYALKFEDIRSAGFREIVSLDTFENTAYKEHIFIVSFANLKRLT